MARKPKRKPLSLFRCSFLNVYEYDKEVVITYGGNMGATIEHNVVPILDERYGLGVTTLLRLAGKETGSPAYDWTLKVPKQKFREITNTVPLF